MNKSCIAVYIQAVVRILSAIESVVRPFFDVILKLYGQFAGVVVSLRY